MMRGLHQRRRKQKMTKRARQMIGKIVVAIGVVALVVSSGIPFVSSAHEGDDYFLPKEDGDLENPIQPTNESISSGKNIYETNCAACHGTDGKPTMPLMDDGTDFSDRQMMSQTSDGQMFMKISDGVERSQMDSWKDTLSEEDRWNVINYIRTLSSSETGARTPSTTTMPAPTTSKPEPDPVPENKGICGPTVVMFIGILPLAAYRIYRGRTGG